MTGRARLSGGAALTLVVLALAGCGGGDDEPTTGTQTTASTTPTTATAPPPTTAPVPKPLPPPAGPAADVEELAERFEAYTGVPGLVDQTGAYGPEMEADGDAPGADRFALFWAVWTTDDAARERELGAAKPRADGWYVSRGGEELARAYGDRLVLTTFADADVRDGIAPDVEAAARAVEAAYAGDPSLLPAAERACDLQGVDPLTSPAGGCALDGVPTTAVDAGTRLATDDLEAEITGVEVRESVASKTASQSAGAGERLVVVGFEVANRGPRELLGVEATLRIGDETYADDPAATALVTDRFFGLLDAGASAEVASVFRVPEDEATRVREEGALVLPIGAATPGFLDDESGQAWLRLEGAPDELPSSPRAKPEPGPGAPQGPPNIPVQPGNGPEIGSAARSSYTASSFFPIPSSFQQGGVPVGTRAGACRVPAVTERDRAQLAAVARRADPRDEQSGIFERYVLLAECGALGDFGIVFWSHDSPKGDHIISGDEVVRRDGRWVTTDTPFYPGCGIPLDAAAAWMIDVSHCPPRAERRRPAPKGELA